MDDYSLSSLNESKNEWCARLLNVLTPHFIQGVQSIYDESVSICKTNKQLDKYLMTFQNFLARIPHWNNHIIETERERIIEASDCTYLQDLITCIHIIQLKMLSCMRVSHENKKIDMKFPSLDTFIHSVYINIAKKLYTNVYLFESSVEPMMHQRNNREIEIIVRECIINTVRDNIPVNQLLRIFMDESEEHDVETVTHTRVEDESSEKENKDNENTDSATNENDSAEGSTYDKSGDAFVDSNDTITVKKSGSENDSSESSPFGDTSKSNGQSSSTVVEERPLPVADITFPTDSFEESKKVDMDDSGSVASVGSVGSGGGGGGITFSDTITEVSPDGQISKHEADGYSADDEVLKIGGDIKNSEVDIDLGIEELTI